MHLSQSKWLVDNRQLNLQLRQRGHFSTSIALFIKFIKLQEVFFTCPCIYNECSIDLSDLLLFLTQYIYEKTAETGIVRKQTAHSLSKFLYLRGT